MLNEIPQGAVAVIGGSGFYEWSAVKPKTKKVSSVYASASLELQCGYLGKRPVYFLPRHGWDHSLPPHKINYRANIDILSQLDIKHIIAVNAVGGISSEMAPGSLVLPDQVIDYTWGREHTFFDAFQQNLEHIDFTYPFASPFRTHLESCLSKYSCTVFNKAWYGCVQGPRLETAAEVRKLAKDGCDLVGMTLMPEAALARERGISYLSLCIVCNWAAGVKALSGSVAPISIEDIKSVLAESLTKVKTVLQDTLTSN